MIDVIQSLWRELLGSWWVLIVLPALALFRWLLTSRWSWVAGGRHRFFELGVWDAVLAPPAVPARRTGDNASSNGSSGTIGVTHPSNGAETSNGAAIGSSGPIDSAEYRRRWFLELIESGLVALLLVFFVIRPFVVQAFYIPSPSMVETLQVYDRILVNKFIYHIHPPQRGDIVVFEPPPRATEKPEDDWIKRVIGIPGDRIAVRQNHLYLNGRVMREPYVSLIQQGTDRQPGEKPVETGAFTYSFPTLDRPDSLRPGESAYLLPASEGPITEAGAYRIEKTSDTTPRAGDDYLFYVRNDPKDGIVVIVPPGKLFVMGDNRNDSEDSHYWGYLDQKRVLGQAFCIFWPFSRFRFLPNPNHS